MHDRVFHYGHFDLDERRGELLRAGVPVPIRPKPLKMLAFLLCNPGRVVPKEELIDAVWPDVAVSDASFSTALKQVRHTIGDDGHEQTHIQTLRGRGIRLSGSVEVEVEGSIEASEQALRSCEPLYVGRRGMLTRLTACLERIDSSHGAVVILTGERGVGKTATAERLIRPASDRGLEPHMGACLDAHGTPPLWPFIEVLTSLLETQPKPDTALGHLIQELLCRARKPSRSGAGLTPEQQFLTLASIARGLAVWSRHRPITVVVDDLQWADRDSALLFELLAREAARHPILLIGAVRNRELPTGHPVVALLGNLARQYHAIREQIEALTAEEAGELITTLTAVPQAAPVSGHFARNPFVLRQPLENPTADHRAQLPGAVRDAIRAQLPGLTDGARELLAVCAAAGSCRQELIERVAGGGPRYVEEALESARRAGFIECEREGTVRFSQSPIRELVYSETPRPKRVRLHRKIAEAMECLYEHDLEPHLGALAYHFGEAIPGGEVSRAIEYAIRAARHAESRLAFEEALEWAERALGWVEMSSRSIPNLHRRALLARANARAARAGSGSGPAHCELMSNGSTQALGSGPRAALRVVRR